MHLRVKKLETKKKNRLQVTNLMFEPTKSELEKTFNMV